MTSIPLLADSSDAVVVELPEKLPALTPGLARALARIIVKAGRVAESTEIHAGGGSEVLAS